MKKILLLITLLLFCTSCYNYREINDLAIVSAIGIEKEKEMYKVTTQIVNVKKSGAEQGNENISKIVVYKGKGHNISEALRNITDKSSKNLFYAHLKLVVLDKNVITKDLYKSLDFLARNTESKISFNVVTTLNDSPSQIIETLTPMESLPTDDIVNILNISQRDLGTTSETTYEELLNIMLQKGINPVYTNLKIEGNPKKGDTTNSLSESNPQSTVVTDNLVTFDEENNITKLNKYESLGYNFITNNIKKATITSKCSNKDNNYFTIELVSSKSGFKLNLKQNEVTINVKAVGDVAEINCDKHLKKISTKKQIQKITKNKIKKYIHSTLKACKDNKNDFIGVGNYIYKNEDKYFNFNKQDWDKEGLNKLKFKVKVKIDITKEGNLNTNILESDISD